MQSLSVMRSNDLLVLPVMRCPQNLVNAYPDPDHVPDPEQKIKRFISNHLLKVKKKKSIFKSEP